MSGTLRYCLQDLWVPPERRTASALLSSAGQRLAVTIRASHRTGAAGSPAVLVRPGANTERQYRTVLRRNAKSADWIRRTHRGTSKTLNVGERPDAEYGRLPANTLCFQQRVESKGGGEGWR